MGQSGTGKKRLLRQLVLMSNRSFNFIKVEGRATSQRYEESSWNDLRQALEKLGDEMGISLLEEEDDLISVWNQLQVLSKEKPLLILLENAQWIDAVSLEKVKQLEERRNQEKWQLIFTAEEPLPASFVNFLGSLKVEKRLSQLELTNFDPSESRALLKGELGAIEPAVMEQMVEWSEGSPFLLSSYIEEWKENENLEPLPDIIQAYLSQELGDMSSEEEALLHYLSCFHKPISLSILAELTATELPVLTELIEPLSERAIVSIVEEGEALLVQFASNWWPCIVTIFFRQLDGGSSTNKLRKNWKKALEDSTDLLLYKEIAYQYKQSQNLLRSISFELTYLEEILQLEHELFPIYSKVDEGFLSDGTNSHLDILESYPAFAKN